ncbi:MAG: hypothetical protein NW202_13470 [Nitrospira sp.]|nr:hypothetical protein [Nitrospira sp.]
MVDKVQDATTGDEIAEALSKRQSKAAAKVDSSTVRYDNASSDEAKALWAKHGRERVKGLPGYKKMTLGDIARALTKEA